MRVCVLTLFSWAGWEWGDSVSYENGGGERVVMDSCGVSCLEGGYGAGLVGKWRGGILELLTGLMMFLFQKHMK